jgi:hypothetical protein
MNKPAWIDHDGSGIPVPADTLVKVRFRDGDDLGTSSAVSAGFWGGNNIASNWTHDPETGNDIIAYQIVRGN